METLSYMVYFSRIECKKTTGEWGKDEIWCKTLTYSDPANPQEYYDVTHYYENSPLHMNAKNDSIGYIDIAVPAGGVYQIVFRLYEKDGHNGKEIGQFSIYPEDVVLHKEMVSEIKGSKSTSYAEFKVYWRVTENILPTLRLLGIYCQKTSAGCNAERMDKVASVKSEIYGDVSDVIGLDKGPTAQLISDAFLVASLVVERVANIKEWILNAIEGADDVYLQHVDKDQADNTGGGFCPPNTRTMKMYEGKGDDGRGTDISFMETYNQYFRFPLDNGPVTIQVREYDAVLGDACLGSLTADEAFYNDFKNAGANVAVLGDYLDRRNGEGSVYHLCFSVGPEDWAKPPAVDANGQQVQNPDGIWGSAVKLGPGGMKSHPNVVAWGEDEFLVFASKVFDSSHDTGLAKFCHITKDSVGDWCTFPNSQSGGDLIFGAPAAVVLPSGEVHVVFHRSSDNNMRHFKRAKGSDNWMFVADFPAGDATDGLTLAGSLEPGRLDLFTRRSNGQMEQRTYKNGTWGTNPVIDTSCNIEGAPAAVVWGPDWLDIIACGTSNSILWHRYWASSSIGWKGWESLSSDVKIYSPPSITSSGVGKLDCFALDNQGRVMHLAWTGEQWTRWRLLDNGAVCDGMPAGVAHGNNQLDVFAKGLDGYLYRMSRIL